MNNAELIKALRCCASLDTPCKGLCPYHGVEYCLSKKDLDAADALEAAEKRIKELEAQMPKEGEWIGLFGHDYKCSVCGEWYRMDGTPEQEDMNYCPNCGARMKGERRC